MVLENFSTTFFTSSVWSWPRGRHRYWSNDKERGVVVKYFVCVCEWVRVDYPYPPLDLFTAVQVVHNWGTQFHLHHTVLVWKWRQLSHKENLTTDSDGDMQQGLHTLQWWPQCAARLHTETIVHCACSQLSQAYSAHRSQWNPVWGPSVTV